MSTDWRAQVVDDIRSMVEEAVPEVVEATERAGGRHLATFDLFERALAGLGARF